VYDTRIVMDMVHRYGRAVDEHDYTQVGLLYSQIARAIEHGHEETAPAESRTDPTGAREAAAA
jgi:hypothetical protein